MAEKNKFYVVKDVTRFDRNKNDYFVATYEVIDKFCNPLQIVKYFDKEIEAKEHAQELNDKQKTVSLYEFKKLQKKFEEFEVILKK
jgi:hypothetical protein